MTAKAKVVPIGLVEIGDERRVKASQILKAAKREKLSEILIIGRDDNGELWAQCSLNAGQSLWLIEKLRERLLDGSPWGMV